MKIKLLLLEGSHEIAFAHRIAKIAGLRFIEPTQKGIETICVDKPEVFGEGRVNLNNIYTARIKDKFYNKEGVYFDLAPLFYFDDRDSSIVISWNYGGKTNKNQVNYILQSVENIFFRKKEFSVDEITSFSIFLHTDADDDSKVDAQKFIDQFDETDFLLRTGIEINEPDNTGVYSNAFKIKEEHRCFDYVEKVDVSFYVLTSDIKSTKGNLDMVLDLLLKTQKHHSAISEIVNSEDYKNKGKHKAIIGALGQEYAPGSSNVVFIGDDEFITNDQIRTTDFYKALEVFISTK